MWLRHFIQENEEDLIRKWLTYIQTIYTDKLNEVDLRRNANWYIPLMLDIDIPLEEHEFYKNMFFVCRHHNTVGTPVTNFLKSFSYWRKLFISSISEFIDTKQLSFESFGVLPTINTRIDNLQTIFVEYYLNQCNQTILKQEQTIQEFHEDRLNLLGKMAASMAHEIKNPLFAIQGFMKLIRRSLSEEAVQQVGFYMDVIDKECEGLYRQITTFLGFSKNDGNEEPVVKCSVDEIVASVFSLVYPRVVAEDIDIEHIKDNDSRVMVQKIGIQQVLINLINNSIDALSNADYSKKIKVIHGMNAGGGYFISVSDNGPGVPKEIKDTIFEPFVTTKKSGTGLGLSICRQIMSKNQGDLTCTSLEKETTFMMTLAKECVVPC